MARTYYPKAHHPLLYAAIDDVCGVPEAAERLRAAGTPYHPRTIRQWCDTGYIAAKRNAFGYWKLSYTSLQYFLRNSARIDEFSTA